MGKRERRKNRWTNEAGMPHPASDVQRYSWCRQEQGIFRPWD